MPRRVLQIIPTLDRSGAEKQLALLARGLPADEFDVHVCVLTRSGPLAAELSAAGIEPVLIGKRLKFDPFALRRLAQHIRKLQPDLVQTWLFAANCYGRVAARWAGVKRIVASERCVDPWKRPHEFWLDRRLAGWTDRIVVNSAGIRDFYVAHGLPAEKFAIIPNAVLPPHVPAEPPEQLRAELGLPPTARLIVSVGRLWQQKRMKDVIWAADLLKVIRSDTYVLIVGDGPQRALLERFVDQVRIADHVRLLGHRPDVPRILAQSEMLWLASEYEGLPNVILEAMAQGLPVVATDIPGNRDVVAQGATGFLVPVGDRASLARYSHQLLEDPLLARNLGAAGRARVAAEFSLERMVDRYAALYRELLG